MDSHRHPRLHADDFLRVDKKEEACAGKTELSPELNELALSDALVDAKGIGMHQMLTALPLRNGFFHAAHRAPYRSLTQHTLR